MDNRPEPAFCPGPCNREYRAGVFAYELARRRFKEAQAVYLEARSKHAELLERLAAARRAGRPLRTEIAIAPAVPPVEPIPPQLTPRSGYPIWCERDGMRVRDALVGLSNDTLLLVAEGQGLRALPGRDGARRGKAAAAPSPSVVVDKVDEVHCALAKAEREFLALTGHVPPPRTGELGLVYLFSAVGVMLPQMLAQDRKGLFGRRLLQLHREVRRMAGTETRWEPLAAPCPQCDQKTLAREPGGDRVECSDVVCDRTNGLVMTWPEYETYAARTAERAAYVRQEAG